MNESNLVLDDGRTWRFYDQGPSKDGNLAVFWLHGTPNIGLPPEPLFADAARLGLRWLGYDRPGYGGSTSLEGRDVRSAAFDVARIAEHLDIEHFAVVGHSGGGPHALACAALLPDRVLAAVSVAGLRAALAGSAAKAAYEASSPEFDPAMFTERDWAALSGPWAWLHSVVEPAMANGPGALIDDDMAYVTPWGFECAQIAQPVLLLHGAKDRVVPKDHGEWLACQCPSAELWLLPEDGHISVLMSMSGALEWLRERVPENT